MRYLDKDYNLKFIFALKSGHYLTDVLLTISNSRQEQIFSMKSKGPWFYVNVPEGEYEVTAVYGDQAQKKEINAGKACQSFSFYWDTAPD